MDVKTRNRSSRAASADTSAEIQHSGRRKRKKNPYRALSRRLFALAAVLIVALGAVFFLRFRHTHIPSEKKLRSYLDEGTYLSGIVINGKNVSGMTLNEARSAISPMIEETAKGVNIGVSYGSSLWLFTGADMKLSTDLEYVLAEAMLYGRGDTAAVNSKAKKELKELGKEFAVSFSPDTPALKNQIADIAAADGLHTKVADFDVVHKGGKVHGVGMHTFPFFPGKYDLGFGFPQRVQQHPVSAVTDAGFVQRTVQGDSKVGGIGITLPEQQGSTFGAHGVGRGGTLADFIDLADGFHKKPPLLFGFEKSIPDFLSDYNGFLECVRQLHTCPNLTLVIQCTVRKKENMRG